MLFLKEYISRDNEIFSDCTDETYSDEFYAGVVAVVETALKNFEGKENPVEATIDWCIEKLTKYVEDAQIRSETKKANKDILEKRLESI